MRNNTQILKLLFSNAYFFGMTLKIAIEFKI
jgi:hypothetical protein